MDRNEPARPSFTDFFSVLTKYTQSRQTSNSESLKQITCPEVCDELAIQGIAVLSDN